MQIAGTPWTSRIQEMLGRCEEIDWRQTALATSSTIRANTGLSSRPGRAAFSLRFRHASRWRLTDRTGWQEKEHEEHGASAIPTVWKAGPHWFYFIGFFRTRKGQHDFSRREISPRGSNRRFLPPLCGFCFRWPALCPRWRGVFRCNVQTDCCGFARKADAQIKCVSQRLHVTTQR